MPPAHIKANQRIGNTCPRTMSPKMAPTATGIAKKRYQEKP
ncbi:MAG: hypothetical protein O7E54_06115 [Planctomycetota bacterium]|nr:hypothetical protein [Planctomycetota bacterium]